MNNGPAQNQAEGTKRSFLSELRGFFIFFFTGFGCLDCIIRRRTPINEVDEVVLYQFHTGIYLWLWILFGFVGALMVKFGVDPTALGWIYLAVIMYTLVTILFDIARNVMLIIILAVAFLAVSGLYLQDHVNIPVLTTIYNFFAGMNVRLDPGFANALSWMLLVPFVCILVEAYFDGRIRITSNEIEVYHYGKMTESISRVGKKIRERYRDLNETVLGLGSADMVILDYNGQEERVLNNVVGLRFQWARIDKILEVWDTEVKNQTEQVIVQS